MTEELKPCPFCGSKAIFDIEPDEEFGDMYFAHCEECDCGTLPQFDTSEAAEIWNTRADIQKTCIFTYDEDLHYWECSECEGTLYFSGDSPDSPKDNGYCYCPYCGRKIIKEVRSYE